VQALGGMLWGPPGPALRPCVSARPARAARAVQAAPVIGAAPGAVLIKAVSPLPVDLRLAFHERGSRFGWPLSPISPQSRSARVSAERRVKANRLAQRLLEQVHCWGADRWIQSQRAAYRTIKSAHRVRLAPNPLSRSLSRSALGHVLADPASWLPPDAANLLTL